LRAFRVELPGSPYWTVVDGAYEPFVVADRFLRDLRLAGARAESTTKAYVGDIALFLNWCADSERTIETGLRQLGRFQLWLQTTPIERRGRGAGSARGARRINRVLVAVREFAKHAVRDGSLSADVLGRLYGLPPSDQRPDGEAAGAVHRLRVERRGAPRFATLDEWEALALAAISWRDRFLLVLLWYTGLRIGEALGLRRSDLHLVDRSTVLGCDVDGPHLHVRRRENANGARAKGRDHTVPVHQHVISVYDLALAEREQCAAAAASDFVFVNQFHRPLGEPMKPDTVEDLFARLSRKAVLERRVTPHMLRHSVGTDLAAAKVPIDVIAEMLGHASMRSTEIYLHVSDDRKREAVQRLATRRRGAG
jgi:integrase